jgi:redox-sensitive bicupin YhaK (pirin superfamily)
MTGNSTLKSHRTETRENRLSAQRAVAYRTRGRSHGVISRLMSPGDLGEHLKPFVFLDIFSGVMSELTAAAGLHPHSGIATVTVFTRGDVHFEDPEAGRGHIDYGGVEWMRAGGGVWHGKELSSGRSETIQGFQLWLALPSDLELSAPQSQYIEAKDMRTAGPAYVILGQHEGITSPVKSPDGINYLLVTLGPGERWSYVPPAGHSAGWLALAKGSINVGTHASAGELLAFEQSESPIVIEALSDGATFVLGSAVPHPHELHLGYYSVHTSKQALDAGETRIGELREALIAQGDRRTASGSTPVFRG